MPPLHLHMWTSLRNDGLEWWKTTSGKRNTVAKTTEFRHHRFYSDFDADVTRNSNFSGKGISKNNPLVKTPLHENKEAARSG